MTVAIAGGTGGLGRTLVDAIKARGKHEVLVLSRRVSESCWQNSKKKLKLGRI
jgi:nucleoside-diphosphate-sugar epimerase